MKDSITTSLGINIYDSSGGEIPPSIPGTTTTPSAPNTGFFQNLFSAIEPFIPIIIAGFILLIIAAIIFVICIRHKRNSFSRSTSKFRITRQSTQFVGKIIGLVNTAAIISVVAVMSVIGASPKSADATNSLITIALENTLNEIELDKATITNSATLSTNLEISINTESLNDLDMNVIFDNQNNGISLSTTAPNITLPAGTSSITIPVDVVISEQVAIGDYTEPIDITVEIEEGFWRTSGRDIIDTTGHVTLLKGMNIGSNGITVYYDYQFPDPDNDLVAHNNFTYSELEALGINAVRFDFPARLIADDRTNSANLTYDYREEMFAKFEQILEYAHAHGVGVFFNIHNSYGTNDGYEWRKWETFEQRNLDLTTQLWVDIAEHFKDDKRLLGYDIMNEPMVQILDGEDIYDAVDKWDVAAQNMIDAIREVDENHIIIVEKMNRGLVNNGGIVSDVGAPTGYIFANVTDPQNNLIHQFHDYGNWGYVTQDDDRVANDPWVWPNYDYVGVIKEYTSVNNGTEIWPPARFRADYDSQDTWISAESNNGNLYSPSDSYNLGNVAIVVHGTNLESDSVYYIDSIYVEEYDDEFDVNPDVIYEQTFRYSNVYNSNSYGAVEMEQSYCYDNDGGCYKISGPTSGIVNIGVNHLALKFFPIDSNKLYKAYAKIYAENAPAGAQVGVWLTFSYGSDEQVKPYDKTYLDANIQKYVSYAEDNNVPILNGEFGVLKNGEVWNQLGATQFVKDSIEVYRENYINAAYFSYYDRNTNRIERRAGLRVREYAISSLLPVTSDSDNNVLNTDLYNVLMEMKNN